MITQTVLCSLVVIAFTLIINVWCRKLDTHAVLGYGLKNTFNGFLMESVSGYTIPKVFKSRKEAETYNVDSGLKFYIVPVYKYQYLELKRKDRFRS